MIDTGKFEYLLRVYRDSVAALSQLKPSFSEEYCDAHRDMVSAKVDLMAAVLRNNEEFHFRAAVFDELQDKIAGAGGPEPIEVQPVLPVQGLSNEDKEMIKMMLTYLKGTVSQFRMVIEAVDFQPPIHIGYNIKEGKKFLEEIQTVLPEIETSSNYLS